MVTEQQGAATSGRCSVELVLRIADRCPKSDVSNYNAIRLLWYAQRRSGGPGCG